MKENRNRIHSARFWIAIALAVKGIILLLFIGELGKYSLTNFVGVFGGDTTSYLDPIENYLSNNSYDPDYRMPGYGLIYYLLRLIADKTATYNLLVMLQYVLASVSVYLLALSAQKVFKSDRIFYLVFFSFLVSTFTTVFDIYLLTESLTVSASIFAFYFLILSAEKKEIKYLILSGLLLTWVTFLRPVYLPYYFISILVYTIYLLKCKTNFNRIFRSLLLFSLPFILIDSIWMIRNYNKYEKVQPLTKSTYYPNAEKSSFFFMMNFLQSWGGNYVFWDPSAEIRWFGIKGNANEAHFYLPTDVRIPGYIYTTKFNEDSLRLIKKLFAESNSDTVTQERITELTTVINNKLAGYTLSVKEEHPILFHFTSRLIYLKKFFFHSGTYNLFNKPWSELGFFKRLIKVLYSGEYIFILLTGITGLFLLMYKPLSVFHLFFPLVCLYGILIFPVILRLPEIRYFVPTFPFMLICAMYFMDRMIERYRNKSSQ